MNKTSRTDEPYEGEDEGYNQSPNAMSNDLVTNQDLNGIVNDREQRGRDARSMGPAGEIEIEESSTVIDEDALAPEKKSPVLANEHRDIGQLPTNPSIPESFDSSQSLFERIKYILTTFGKFIGPGFLVSVAYSE